VVRQHELREGVRYLPRRDLRPIRELPLDRRGIARERDRRGTDVAGDAHPESRVLAAVLGDREAVAELSGGPADGDQLLGAELVEDLVYDVERQAELHGRAVGRDLIHHVRELQDAVAEELRIDTGVLDPRGCFRRESHRTSTTTDGAR